MAMRQSHPEAIRYRQTKFTVRTRTSNFCRCMETRPGTLSGCQDDSHTGRHYDPSGLHISIICKGSNQCMKLP